MLLLNILIDIFGVEVRPIGSSFFLLSSYSLITFRSIFNFLILNSKVKLSMTRTFIIIAWIVILSTIKILKYSSTVISGVYEVYVLVILLILSIIIDTGYNLLQ